MRKSVRAVLFLTLFAVATAGVAYAITAHGRTSDWKMLADMYTVLWGADHNAAYGTAYYVVTVGK